MILQPTWLPCSVYMLQQYLKVSHLPLARLNFSQAAAVVSIDLAIACVASVCMTHLTQRAFDAVSASFTRKVFSGSMWMRMQQHLHDGHAAAPEQVL